MVGRGGGSTSFPRSSQWVYSNTERCRGREGDRVRGKERRRGRERGWEKPGETREPRQRYQMYERAKGTGTVA